MGNASIQIVSQAAEELEIIIPVYNEGESILRLYEHIQSTNIVYQKIRVIYDFDEDTTLPHAQILAKKDERLRAEKNEYGKGVYNALRWGFERCHQGPVIVVMGDSSDRLADVPRMVELWERGATIVSPSRYAKTGIQHGGGRFKSFLSGTAGRSLHWLGLPTSDPTNNFKLYDGEWLSAQRIESVGGFEVALELCYKALLDGKEIAEIPTEWFDRTAGVSQFKLFQWIPQYLRWYFCCAWLLLKRKFVS